MSAASPGCDGSPVSAVEPQRLGRGARGPCERFLRRQAEECAGHVHRQEHRGHGRGARGSCRRRPRSRRRPRAGRRLEAPWSRAGCRTRRAGEPPPCPHCAMASTPGSSRYSRWSAESAPRAAANSAPAEIRELLGMELDRQAQPLGGIEDAPDLGGGEGDALAEPVDRVRQALGMGGFQRGDANLVDVAVGMAACARAGRHGRRESWSRPVCRSRGRGGGPRGACSSSVSRSRP